MSMVAHEKDWDAIRAEREQAQYEETMKHLARQMEIAEANNDFAAMERIARAMNEL